MIKPGHKSSEFWLSVALVVCTNVIAFEVLPKDSELLKCVMVVAATLTTLGYGGGRAFVKAAELKARKEAP